MIVLLNEIIRISHYGEGELFFFLFGYQLCFVNDTYSRSFFLFEEKYYSMWDTWTSHGHYRVGITRYCIIDL